MKIKFFLSTLQLALIATVINAYWIITPILAFEMEKEPDPKQEILGPFVGVPVEAVIFEGDVRDLPQVKDNSEPGVFPFNFADPEEIGAEAQSRGPDPVLQSQLGVEVMPSPSITFNGLDFLVYGAGWPPDTNGDVGPDHYIQSVNTSIGIFNKHTGERLASFSFNGFWNGTGTVCDNNNSGDPIVVYDQIADRWLVTDFAFARNTSGNPEGPYYECIALSRTGNPVSGGWYLYAWKVSDTDLPDYPKFSLWHDAYYMTASIFANASSFSGVNIYAFNRDAMLSGGALQEVHFSTSSSYRSLLPSNVRGPLPPAGAPNYVMSASLSSATLNFWKFHVDWANLGNSTFTGPTVITPASFSTICSGTRNCIEQPGTTQMIDALSSRLLMQLQYRRLNDGTESLWATHTVDNGSSSAAVRWYEIRNLTTTPSIYQQGTFSPDATHRWMASIAADRQGNMAAGFSVSNASDVYPSIRIAGRLVSDDLNVLGQSEIDLFTGSDSQDSYNRWGDYSAMTIDPDDDCTFWYTNEYYTQDTAQSPTQNTNWQTGIGAFRFSACNNTKTWVGNTSSAWDDGSNWSPSGSPSRWDNVVIDPAIKTTFWPEINAAAEAHSITIVNGGQLNAEQNFNLRVYGDWIQSGSGAFNANAGSVVFLGTSPQLNAGIPGAGNHFNHLLIGDDTRFPELILQSHLRVDGSLISTSLTSFDAGSHAIEIGGNANFGGTYRGETSNLRFTGNQGHELTMGKRTYTVKTILLNEDFETWPLPTGWQITGSGCVWRAGSGDSGALDANKASGNGDYADADSSDCGGSMDTSLETPILNLTDASGPKLQFKSDMRWSSNSTFNVDLSIDGGSTWATNLLTQSGDSKRGPEMIEIDMGIAAGESNTRIRFRYQGNNDGHWQVDEVRLVEEKLVPALYDLETTGTGTISLLSPISIEHNLSIGNGTKFNILNHELAVGNEIINNGALSQQLSVAAGPTTTRFLNILNHDKTNNLYYGVDITPNGSGLGDTIVEIRGNQPACNQGNELIERCFDLTPSTSQAATLRFWYLNSEKGSEVPSTMNAYHWENPGWQELTPATSPRGSLGVYEWVEADNVNNYSPFGLSDGNPATPTIILLHNLSAKVNHQSSWYILLVFSVIFILLTWYKSRAGRNA